MKHISSLHPFLMELREHVKEIISKFQPEWIVRSPLIADNKREKREEE